MIKKRFLLPAAAGALALAIGLAGIWFNQQLPALADFGVSGMDSEAQLMAWAALFPEKGVAAPDLPHGAAVDGHCSILHSGSGGAGPVPIQASEGTGIFSAVSDGADPLGSGDHSGSGGKFRLERLFPPGILYRHGSGGYPAVCRPDRGCTGVSRAATPFPASDAGISCSDADSPQPCTGGGGCFWAWATVWAY